MPLNTQSSMGNSGGHAELKAKVKAAIRDEK